MDLILIGNIVALAGACLMVAGGVLKRRRDILLLQCVQFGVQTGSNLLLGGLTGAVSNALSVARNLYCLRWNCPLPACLAFIAVQAGITLGVNDMGAVGWLPVAATAAFTLVINNRDPVMLKLAAIAGQTCWGVYDFTIRNYAGLAFDVFGALSNLWGIFLVRRGIEGKKEKGAQGAPDRQQEGM